MIRRKEKRFNRSKPWKVVLRYQMHIPVSGVEVLRLLITIVILWSLFKIQHNRVNSTATGTCCLRVVIKCMHLRISARMRARMLPSIKISEQDDIMQSLLSRTAGAPLSQDATSNLNIRNSDHNTKDKISNLRMHPCSVRLHDIFFMLMTQHC